MRDGIRKDLYKQVLDALPWIDDDGHLTRLMPIECVKACSHAGDCSEDVKAWRKRINFTVPRHLAIPWLKEFGAHTAESMAWFTDDEIAEQVLWLFCCDIKEGNPVFGLHH
jgi:hypothetical protein